MFRSRVSPSYIATAFNTLNSINIVVIWLHGAVEPGHLSKSCTEHCVTSHALQWHHSRCMYHHTCGVSAWRLTDWLYLLLSVILLSSSVAFLLYTHINTFAHAHTLLRYNTLIRYNVPLAVDSSANTRTHTLTRCVSTYR